GDIPLIIGATVRNTSLGKPLYNGAYVLRRGLIEYLETKTLLPEYDVFDEHRYFEPKSNHRGLFIYKGKKIGLLICEDIWHEDMRGIYRRDPIEELEIINPDLVIAINASPYFWGKGSHRFELVKKIVQRLQCDFVYANQVGANDDLIFDGRSFAINAAGLCVGAAKSFVEEIAVFDTDVETQFNSDESNLGELEAALVLGVRDYIEKLKIPGVVIASSGGIDSAYVTYLAVKALGDARVMTYGMPSKFSSAGSVSDAQQLAANLKIPYIEMPIGEIYAAVGDVFGNHYGWEDDTMVVGDVTEENVQARIRGLLIMAVSNRTGNIVLSTGNKSEMSVGYCTLYGDMSGGLAPIVDVPKTLVYRLASYANRNGEIIPVDIINKAPSAELRPGQKDTDSLPPYDILDPILQLYIEHGESVEEITAQGYPQELVSKVTRMVDRNEFKRRQSPVGLKVTSKAFGSGRRLPIVCR
ncbi:MAG: NAD+ synthase, partial [Candidatus Komeilibacteria bacterium]|nr:NAD+ synthase [Candidatus Komeilibacteria bacterium]